MNNDTKDLMWLLGTAVAVIAVAFSPLLVPAPWDDLVHMFGVPLIGGFVVVLGLSRSRRLVAAKPVQNDQAR